MRIAYVIRAHGLDRVDGAFSRAPADEFPAYHSCADDLDLVPPDQLTSRTQLPFADIRRATDALAGAGLLEELPAAG